MNYKINLIKPEEEYLDSEIKKLSKELEDKFLRFKKDRADDLSYIDALIEYSNKYDINLDFIGELISYSELITSRIKKQFHKEIEFKEIDW